MLRFWRAIYEIILVSAILKKLRKVQACSQQALSLAGYIYVRTTKQVVEE